MNAYARKASRRLAALTAMAMTAVLAGQVSSQESARRGGKHDRSPLVIESQGSFYVGGVPKVTRYANSPTPMGTQPNQITIGQMYVQFQIPQAQRGSRPWPVVHVHGSSHSGAALESTPDGREGWLTYFVRHGVPSYVVDQPGRGRSGFDPSVFHEAEAMMATDPVGAAALLPTIGRITDNGAWTNWFGHLVVPGTCTPSTDILTGQLVQHGWADCDPSLPTVHPNPAGYLPKFPIGARTPPQAPPNLAPVPPFADANLGPTPYGPAAYHQLNYYRQLLPNGEATLPGSTCPSCSLDPNVPANTTPTELTPANTWSPYDLSLLVERIGGAIVATHSQSGIQGHHMVRNLRERGSLINLRALITIEGNCSLNNSGLTPADFDDVAYLALVGDYTVDSPTCIDTVAQINARRDAGFGTAKAAYIKLDADRFGGRFNGTTHMMMLGTNHLAVAELIKNWVDENVPTERNDLREMLKAQVQRQQQQQASDEE